jgi:hypothetical protein
MSKTPHRKPGRKKSRRTAASSDLHELYELSVQDPTNEVVIINQIWKEQRTGTCTSIREDFCGTAAVAMEWVKNNMDHTAVGIDLDQPVLDWAKVRIPERLSAPQQKRLTLINGDVRTTKTEAVDCLLAHNFSYYIFKQRSALVSYFASTITSLKDNGIIILDAYGGSDSFVEMEEDRDLDGFTYTWDQSSYNPITGDVVNYIHFSFPDGTRIENAFTYEWRLWTIPEIKEILLEAGYRDVVVYWEGTDDDDEGNGVWTATDQGEACQGWIAYIVGIR